MQEIGLFEGRKECRQFYYEFLRPSLRNPDDIALSQKRISYEAFKTNKRTIILNAIEAFESEPYESGFIIDISVRHDTSTAKTWPKYKQCIVESLNRGKENNLFCQDFDTQLQEELNSDFQLFNNLAHSCCFKEEYFPLFLTSYSEYLSVTMDGSPTNQSVVENYLSFLKSQYHHSLPYIWIQSNLWALYVTRPNKIKSGDYLDIKWASAYLPFVDYAITDNAFCEAIKNLKLDNYCKTQVYSLQTIDDLVNAMA